MAGRQTFIEMSIKTTKVANGIRAVLELLQKVEDKMTNLNKFKLGIVDESVIVKQLNRIEVAQVKLRRSAEETNKKLSEKPEKVKENVDEIIGAFAKLQIGLSAVSLTYQSFLSLFDKVSNYTKVESNIANLNIASNKGLGDMRSTLKEFLGMSSEIPKNVNELITTADALVRTGRTYKEALEITKETAKLSVATGEDLDSTAKTVTKVMVSLGIESKQVKDVLNILHSTAIQTASSMESISGGMNQVAGSLGAIAQSSGRSGEELAKYKKELLEVGAVGLGVMNNLGKSASESGTKVKVLFTRLITMEKTARGLFNKDTKDYKLDDKYMKALGTSSNKLDADVLSQLARKDLPLAIELMSKLKVEGVVTGQTIQKMFTQRHALDMEVYLGQVNGNIQNIVDTVTKGKDYMTDFKAQMFTLTNQVELFKNNLNTISVDGVDLVKGTFTSLLYIFNQLMKNNPDSLFNSLSKGIITTGVSSVYLSKQVLTVAIAFGQLKHYLGLNISSFADFSKALKGGVATLLSSGLGWVTVGLTTLSFAYYYYRKVKEEAIQSALKTSQSLDSITQDITKNQAIIESLRNKKDNNMVYEFEFRGFVDLAIQQNDLTKQITELIDNQKKALDSRPEYELKLQATLDSEKTVKNIQESIAKIKEQQVADLEDTLNSVLEKSKKAQSEGQLYKVSELRPVELAIKFKIADLQEDQAMKKQIEQEFYRYQNKYLDVASAIEIIGEYSTSTAKKISKSGDEITSLADKIAKVNEETQEAFSYISNWDEDVLGSSKALEMYVNNVNSELINSGMYLDPINLKMLSWKDNTEELLKMFDDTFSKEWKIDLDSDAFKKAQNRLKELRAELDSLPKNNQVRVDIITREIKQLEYQQKEAQYLSKSVGILSTEEVLKKAGVDPKKITTKQLATTQAMQRNMQSSRYATEKQKFAIMNDYDNEKITEEAMAIRMSKLDEAQKKNEELTYFALNNDFKNSSGSSNKPKKSKGSGGGAKKETEYKMEYVKLQERSLSLEQTIALINKEGLEREYQQYLNKQQSLKLELDTLKATKERLTLESQKYIQKGADESDKAFMERIKARIEEITAMGTLKGKSGQAMKEEQQELAKLYDSYMSYLNKYDNFAINSLEMLSKALENIKNKQYEVIDSIIAYKKSLYDMNKLSNTDYFSALTDSIDISKLKIEDVKNSIRDLKLENLSSEMKNAVQDLINSDGIDQQALTLYAKLDIQDTQSLEKRLKALQDKKQNGLALTQEEEKEMEELVLQLDIQLKLREKIKELQDKSLASEQAKLELIKAQNNVAQKSFSQLGAFFKGSGTGKAGASLGGLFDALGGYANSMTEQGKGFLPPALLETLGKFGKFFQGVNADAQTGQAIASAFGLGGGQTSQLFGSLGSLGASALGMASPYGMMISTGLSMLGGIMDKRKQKKQGEADKKTELAKKQYDENTKQLQLVSSRLESLNTNLLSLNQSMVSIFSSMPTIDNISRVLGGMEKLYGIINVNRDFGSASFMTQESKKTGNWLTGKSTVTWLENHQMNTQQLLKEYGFNGGILDMSVKQLENFSKWLKSYNKGIQNNFNEYAKIVDNYVTSMITIKDMMDKFSYRVTFESFSGFSVSKQEDLVKNLTQIYKDAGITITEGITQQIKELAEQMSVMVTIMSDVRKDFLTQWKDSGKTAGNSFVTAMKPYVESILNNMTQVYFDTVFSNSAHRLELQFKHIGDLLFDLKKKGRDLTWEKIANDMRTPFSNVVDLLREAQERTDTFTTALSGLQKVAKEKGMSISEMSTIGLLSKTQQSMFENFKSAIQSTDVNSALTSVGTLVGNTIGEEMSKRLVDRFMGNRLTELSEEMDKTLRGNMNLNDLSKISQMAMSTGLQLETERRKLTAIRDMFNFNKDINYQNNNNEIKYETGTSQTVINNFYISGQVNAGVVIPQNTVKEFVQATTNDLIDTLNTDKGIDLRKLI